MAEIVKYSTRVQLKYDTWANWNSNSGKAFIPLKGEVCICEIPAETAASGEVLSTKACLIKVGDGVTTFGSLPWLSAQAADVYEWAKKSEADFKTWLTSDSGPALATKSEVSAINTSINNMDLTDPIASGTATSVITNISQANGKVSATKKNLPTVSDPTASGNSITFIDTISQTNGAISATKKTIYSASATQSGIVKLGATGGAATYETVSELSSTVSAMQNKISNAMHFLGITTTSISDGSTTATIAIKEGETTKNVTLTSSDAGAVVLTAAPSATGIQYEYVWTGSAWGQLGQEGSFAVKGSIANGDISSSAAIAPTKIASSFNKADLSKDLETLNTNIGEATLAAAGAQVSATSATTKANTANNAIAAMNADDPTAANTASTTFIDTISQTNGKITATKKTLPSATTSIAGIVKLTNSTSSTSTTTAATPKSVKDAYDLANSASSQAATNKGNIDKTWQTSTINKVGTNNTTMHTVAASSLTIAGNEIQYIIFDCGSSTVNI